jgi:serine/threonine protein kinase
MLCGYLPFEDKDNDALFEKILECKLVFPKYIPKLGKNLIEKILVKNPNRRITIKEIKEHPFYLKGKELFEQEFSICQIENNMDKINTDDEINNIMDIHVLNYNNDSLNDDEKEIEGKNKIKNNEKINEKKMSKEKKKKIPKNRLLLNGLDAENFILRIKTEGDEEK